MTNPTQIHHSSFARYTLYRETVRIMAWNHDATCDNCGSTAHDRAKHPILYKYSTVLDGFGARINYIPGAYCSVSCMRAYNDLTETP